MLMGRSDLVGPSRAADERPAAPTSGFSRRKRSLRSPGPFALRTGAERGCAWPKRAATSRWSARSKRVSTTSPTTAFRRRASRFSIPTKLGVFTSGPYFHDHAAFSLRAVVDPMGQSMNPIYDDPAYGMQPASPGLTCGVALRANVALRA